MVTLRLRERTLRSRDMRVSSFARLPRLKRASRIVLSGALVAGAVAASVEPNATPVEAAPNDIVAIVIEGTGFGHGRGMSQWGAYGYAVDHGWDWTQILNHYYGGTDSGTTAAGQRISVRLTAYDGLSDVGVISHGNGVRWGGQTAPAMRAVETSAGVFDVYSADQIACPSSTSLSVPTGPVVQATGYNLAAQQFQAFLKRFFDASLIVDGYFGNQTAGVLAAWQQSRGLPVDGSTWNADDATEARAIIAAAGSSVTWTKIGTHTQTAGSPVRFTASDGDVAATNRNDVLGVCSSGGAVNHYRGAIDVVHSSSGNRVVNDVLAEAYLRGVVPKEIAASWANAGGGAGANAVRAQAVAARSYGLQQNRTYTYPGSSQRYATTCDTTACQVYGGSAKRSSATGSATRVEYEATDAAIAATANVVRRWPSGHPLAGQIVSTEFSASNGPRTAGGAFPPVNDIGDDTAPNPNHKWTRVLDADTFASRHGLGTITSASMAPTQSANFQGFDGIWFDDLVVTGTNGTFRQQAWNFRNAYDLRSPGFTVRVVREQTTNKSLGFIGDSVANSIAHTDGEFLRVTDGTFTSRTVDAVDSRCTTREACNGSTGIAAAAALPRGLDLVVVELGYNDDPATFASDIDAMMNALNARDVRQVAWVNMADIRRTGGALMYTASNAALDAATGRWPTLSVLDWEAASNNSERARWFNSDGVHLTATGQAEFALWLRSEILELAPTHFLAPPKKIELPVVGQTLTAADGGTITVPDDAAGVALNVTMVRPLNGGFATIWPCQGDRPTVSSLNFSAGQVVANNVIAPISDDGTVCLYSSVGTDIIVDIAGWFPGGGSGAAADPFVGLVPQRVVDTRNAIGAPTARVQPNAPLRIPVAGRSAMRPDGTAADVPSSAAAVAVNVAIVRSSADGFATVWSCENPMPLASNVNFDAGTIVSNGVVAPVGSAGDICVHVSQPADVLVDLAGFFDGSLPVGGAALAVPAFEAATPTRLVDTRTGLGSQQNFVQPGAPLTVEIVGAELNDPDDTDSVIVVPESATAVALNLTVANPTANGYATIWPCGTEQPLASNINFLAGQNRANSVIAPIGADGTICVFVERPTNVILDVAGWFRGGTDASFVGAVPERLVDTRFSVGPIPAS